MSKASRFSEIWFQRGLWLVAVVFAWFLIGLGGKIISDLPKIEPPHAQEAFMPQPETHNIQALIATQQQSLGRISDSLAEARLLRTARRADVASAKDGFANWIATVRATGITIQDQALVARTQALDTLDAKALGATQAVQALMQQQRAADDVIGAAEQQLAGLQKVAAHAYRASLRVWKLRVFLVRLVFTLPLLLIAGWLFARKRHGGYWPFVWGFIYFALYTFFVELVPYLPSYGGYVRYTVGLLLTFIIGHYAIRGFARYLERQRASERRPETERRQALDYDIAQARLSKGVCPGCERPADLADPARNHCMHCGIALFDRRGCGARKNAFAHFCHACGKPAVTA
ncbi:MAG: serine endopeptidase [Acidiferrobacteraceae bacterium]